jgi:hypothetical protein
MVEEEDKTVEQGFHHGERFEDQERSWVESVNFPEVEQLVDSGVRRGGTVDDDGDGAGEGFLPLSNHVHEAQNLCDGDGSKQIRGKRQNQLLGAGGFLDDNSRNLVPKDTVGGNSVVEVSDFGQSQCKKQLSRDRGRRMRSYMAG